MMFSSSTSSNVSSPSSPEAVETSMMTEVFETQNKEKVSKHRPSYFTPKIKFTPNEDMLLLHAVQSLGTSDWHIIASRVPGRNARQCRERWNNYVNPALISAPWSAEEDRFLMEKYQELGPHWRTIASYFASRSTNSIKNRFTILQRRQRKKNRKSKDKRASINISMPQNLQHNSPQPLLCSSISSVSQASNPIIISKPICPTTPNLAISQKLSVENNENNNDFIFINDINVNNTNEKEKTQEADDLFHFLESFKDAEYAFWSNDFDTLSLGSDMSYF